MPLVVQWGRENETSMKPNIFLKSASDEDDGDFFLYFWMYFSENEKTFIFFFHVLFLRFHSGNRLNLVYISLRIDYRRKIDNWIKTKKVMERFYKVCL